ncbi:MAG TPA: universal stress protein [Acidimicrobiia bacterium]|nr:universal stress protein [Acidimicrobiia bacterium]
MRVVAFGDDHSAGAETCWRWITNHTWDGWSLEVVTAAPHPDMRPVEPGEAELHPWAPETPRDPGPVGFTSVEHLRAEVDPRVALISKPWDLVAIGPKGRGSSGLLSSLHTGSTADWLLRDPVSPLLIARHEETVGKVLVAADGSTHARRAVETLAGMAWLSGVSVRIAAVDDGKVDPEPALETAVEVLGGTGAEIDTVVLSGDPAHALVTEVERTGPDLVVMGARGEDGLRQLVLGSTASAVTGATDRSVLVAHADV